jgi:phosphoglycerol geranylgeranyltransferase
VNEFVDNTLGQFSKPWIKWKHITKLDPDRRNTPELVETALQSGTDAIMISGTQGITPANVRRLLATVRHPSIPIVLEPVNSQSVTFDTDYLFIPTVINSMDRWWYIDAHVDWLQKLRRSRARIPWEKIVPEAYIVLNPRSAVAKVTKCETRLSAQKVQAYSSFADGFLKFPIVYIEYSGVYGNPRLVKSVRETLSQATLFYGGGIDSRERAKEMARHSTIVVGNILYEDPKKYLETIV